MRIYLNPAYACLQSFVERLPEAFDANEGTLIFHLRNTVRFFEVEGLRLAVKRFKRPDRFHAFVYGCLCRSKARRAYEHAVRLRALGIDSPQPVAWCECRHRGLLTDSFLITAQVDDRPLSEVMARFPEPETLSVLDAFTDFIVRLHEAGVEHLDFHHNNVLWHRIEPTGEIRFRLIDVNRMRFHGGPLSLRRRMINLRRLACPTEVFLYLTGHYAEACDFDVDDTLLRSLFFRLMLDRRSALKTRFRRRHQRLKTLIFKGGRAAEVK